MGVDQLDELGDKRLSTQIVLGVVQVVSATAPQRMKTLASQALDQRVVEV